MGGRRTLLDVGMITAELRVKVNNMEASPKRRELLQAIRSFESGVRRDLYYLISQFGDTKLLLNKVYGGEVPFWKEREALEYAFRKAQQRKGKEA